MLTFGSVKNENVINRINVNWKVSQNMTYSTKLNHIQVKNIYCSIIKLIHYIRQIQIVIIISVYMR